MDVSVNVDTAQPFCGLKAFAQIQLACVSLCPFLEPFLCRAYPASPVRVRVHVYRAFRAYCVFHACRVSHACRVFRVCRAYRVHDYVFVLQSLHPSNHVLSLSAFLSLFPCLLLILSRVVLLLRM